MSIKFIDKLHRNSPLPPFNIRYILLLRELHNIEKIQFYSRRELNAYQNQEFKKLISHAFNNVRFYRKWFRENNLSISEFKTISDIVKLPILTKQIIRENFEDFISINSRKFKPYLLMTSGSTGIPFKFYMDMLAITKENASYIRQWRINNYKFRDKRAILRGTLVHNQNTKEQHLWRYKLFNKELNFNTFHMNEENCLKIMLKLKEFKPQLFQVYPMALFILSHYIKKYNFEFPSLKMIHFSSEAYTQIHRDFIKKQFSCPILDRYGQSEIVLNAFECKPENGYHAEEENNILEVLDKNNEHVNENESGRIVGTNLHNYSMPLIRYSTEDLAVMGNEDCDCGRHTKKLKSIQGRILDQIITKDKSLISGISFYHYWKHRISEKIPNVSYVQIIQPKIDKLIVKILPNKQYTNKEEKIINKELIQFVGNLEINYEYIYERPYGDKWRFTISKVSNDEIKKFLK